MVTVGAIGLLLGAILAQYFRVFVLLPFCAAVLISAIALEIDLGKFPSAINGYGCAGCGGRPTGLFSRIGYSTVDRGLEACMVNQIQTYKHACPSESPR